MPALPLDEAGKYVAGAYVVFLALVLIYVAIMATRLQRVERELGELADLAEDRHPAATDPPRAHPATDPDGAEATQARPAPNPDGADAGTHPAAADAPRAHPATDPDGADAGADDDALAVGEGKVFERERSSRQEVR